MKTIDYNAIQKDITYKTIMLRSGDLDVYEFINTLMTKHIEPVFPECMTIEGDSPYNNVIFAMLEINNICCLLPEMVEKLETHCKVSVVTVTKEVR